MVVLKLPFTKNRVVTCYHRLEWMHLFRSWYLSGEYPAPRTGKTYPRWRRNQALPTFPPPFPAGKKFPKTSGKISRKVDNGGVRYEPMATSENDTKKLLHENAEDTTSVELLGSKGEDTPVKRVLSESLPVSPQVGGDEKVDTKHSVDTKHRVPPATLGKGGRTRRVRVMNDVLAIIKYNGQDPDILGAEGEPEQMLMAHYGVHCSKAGNNFDLVLKSEVPFYLTHVEIGGPRFGYTCPIKSAMVFAYMDEQKRNYAEAFRGVNTVQKFIDATADLDPMHPGTPVGFIQTSPSDGFQGSIMIERKHRSSPVRYLHVRLIDSWSEGSQYSKPNIDCSKIVFVGIESSDGLHANQVDDIIEAENTPYAQFLWEISNGELIVEEKSARSKIWKYSKPIFEKVHSIRIEAHLRDFRSAEEGSGTILLALVDPDSRLLAVREVFGARANGDWHTLRDDFNKTSNLVSKFTTGCRYQIRYGGVTGSIRVRNLSVKFSTDNPAAVVKAALNRTIKLLTFDTSLFDEEGEATAILFVSEENKPDQWWGMVDFLDSEEEMKKNALVDIRAIKNSFSRAAENGPIGMTFCVADMLTIPPAEKISAEKLLAEAEQAFGSNLRIVLAIFTVMVDREGNHYKEHFLCDCKDNDLTVKAIKNFFSRWEKGEIEPLRSMTSSLVLQGSPEVEENSDDEDYGLQILDQEKIEALEEEKRMRKRRVITVSADSFDKDILDAKTPRLLFVGTLREGSLLQTAIRGILNLLSDQFPPGFRIGRLNLAKTSLPDHIERVDILRARGKKKVSYDWRKETFPCMVWYNNGKPDKQNTTYVKAALTKYFQSPGPEAHKKLVDRLCNRILLSAINVTLDKAVWPIEYHVTGDAYVVLFIPDTKSLTKSELIARDRANVAHPFQATESKSLAKQIKELTSAFEQIAIKHGVGKKLKQMKRAIVGNKLNLQQETKYANVLSISGNAGHYVHNVTFNLEDSSQNDMRHDFRGFKKPEIFLRKYEHVVAISGTHYVDYGKYYRGDDLPKHKTQELVCEGIEVHTSIGRKHGIYGSKFHEPGGEHFRYEAKEGHQIVGIQANQQGRVIGVFEEKVAERVKLRLTFHVVHHCDSEFEQFLEKIPGLPRDKRPPLPILALYRNPGTRYICEQSGLDLTHEKMDQFLTKWRQGILTPALVSGVPPEKFGKRTRYSTGVYNAVNKTLDDLLANHNSVLIGYDAKSKEMARHAMHSLAHFFQCLPSSCPAHKVRVIGINFVYNDINPKYFDPTMSPPHAVWCPLATSKARQRASSLLGVVDASLCQYFEGFPGWEDEDYDDSKKFHKYRGKDSQEVDRDPRDFKDTYLMHSLSNWTDPIPFIGIPNRLARVILRAVLKDKLPTSLADMKKFGDARNVLIEPEVKFDKYELRVANEIRRRCMRSQLVDISGWFIPKVGENAKQQRFLTMTKHTAIQGLATHICVDPEVFVDGVQAVAIGIAQTKAESNRMVFVRDLLSTFRTTTDFHRNYDQLRGDDICWELVKSNTRVESFSRFQRDMSLYGIKDEVELYWDLVGTKMARGEEKKETLDVKSPKKAVSNKKGGVAIGSAIAEGIKVPYLSTKEFFGAGGDVKHDHDMAFVKYYLRDGVQTQAQVELSKKISNPCTVFVKPLYAFERLWSSSQKRSLNFSKRKGFFTPYNNSSKPVFEAQPSKIRKPLSNPNSLELPKINPRFDRPDTNTGVVGLRSTTKGGRTDIFDKPKEDPSRKLMISDPRARNVARPSVPSTLEDRLNNHVHILGFGVMKKGIDEVTHALKFCSVIGTIDPLETARTRGQGKRLPVGPSARRFGLYDEKFRNSVLSERFSKKPPRVCTLEAFMQQHLSKPPNILRGGLGTLSLSNAKAGNSMGSSMVQLSKLGSKDSITRHSNLQRQDSLAAAAVVAAETAGHGGLMETGLNMLYTVRVTDSRENKGDESLQVISSGYSFKLKEEITDITVANFVQLSSLGGLRDFEPEHNIYNWTSTALAYFKKHTLLFIYSSNSLSAQARKVVIAVAKLLHKWEYTSVAVYFFDMEKNDIPDELRESLRMGGIAPHMFLFPAEGSGTRVSQAVRYGDGNGESFLSIQSLLEFIQNYTVIHVFSKQKLEEARELEETVAAEASNGVVLSVRREQKLGQERVFGYTLGAFDPLRAKLCRRIIAFFYADERGCRLPTKGRKRWKEQRALRDLLKEQIAHRAVTTAAHNADVDRSEQIGYNEMAGCLLLILRKQIQASIIASRASFNPEEYQVKRERVSILLTQEIEKVLQWYFEDEDIQTYIERPIGESFKLSGGFSEIMLALMYVVLVNMADHDSGFESFIKVQNEDGDDDGYLDAKFRNDLRHRFSKLADPDDVAYDEPEESFSSFAIKVILILISPLIMPILILSQVYDEAPPLFSNLLTHLCIFFGITVPVLSIGYGSIANAVLWTLLRENSLTSIEGWGPLVMTYILYFMMATTRLREKAADSAVVNALNAQGSQHEFSEQNVLGTVELFHKDLTVYRRSGSKDDPDAERKRERMKKYAAGNKDRSRVYVDTKYEPGPHVESITGIIEEFLEDSDKRFRDRRQRADFCTKFLCEKKWIKFFAAPLTSSMVMAALPGSIRVLRGKDFTGGGSIPERFVGLMYVAVVLVVLTLLLSALHSWLGLAQVALFQYSGISGMTSSYRAVTYGLHFYIPLNSPSNILGWMLVRRRLYKVITAQLDNIFPMEVLLSPLLLITFLVAIAIMINVVQGEELGVFNIVGFYVLCMLTIYTTAVLFTAAYANALLNDRVVATLAIQKFNSSEAAWQSSKESIVASLPSSTDDEKDDTARTMAYIGESVQETNRKLLDVDTLCAMEMMLDSAIGRIQNPEDEGLYLRVFGVEVTFALLATVASALGTVVIAGASQISRNNRT
ncbi:hypothetical protein AAMO2058_001366900 [Amorphochlora amoebiformis]